MKTSAKFVNRNTCLKYRKIINTSIDISTNNFSFETNVFLVENLEGLCTPENDPGCDHICVMNPLYGALCNCHFGYKVTAPFNCTVTVILKLVL